MLRSSSILLRVADRSPRVLATKASVLRDQAGSSLLSEAGQATPSIRELIEEKTEARRRAAAAEKAAGVRQGPAPKGKWRGHSAKGRPRQAGKQRPSTRSPVPLSELDTSSLRRTNLEALYPHLPAYPSCADDYHYGMCHRPRDVAIRMQHIEFNRHASIDWMLFDRDKGDLLDALERSNLDMPNFIAINPDNGHGHFAYRLANPVLRFDSSRRHPIDYAAGIQRGIMRRIGADPCFNGKLLKNPAHLKWQVRWFSTAPFNLEQLARDLDKSEMAAAAKLSLEIGEGRNVATFEALRKSGYRIVKRYWGDFDGFHAHMTGDAYEMNRSLLAPLSEAEIRSIVKSVCKWIWARFSAEEFSDRQSLRGKRSAAKRWGGHVKSEPWIAMNISRSTYFRRKAINQLATS